MLTDIILIFAKTTNNYDVIIMKVCEKLGACIWCLSSFTFYIYKLLEALTYSFILNYLQIVCYNFTFVIEINCHY